MVPDDAPSMVAVKAMDEAFGNGGAESFIVVAMERSAGLTAQDRTYAESLVDEVNAVTEAIGSNLSPFGAIVLAAFRGDQSRLAE